MAQIQFHIKSANDLSMLGEALVKAMRANKPNVFQPVYIVTQTEGMNNWLREKIANIEGIAANIQFLRPNDIINKIFVAAGGRHHQSLSANEMSWLLFDTLGLEDFQKEFPEVTAYFSADPNADSRRMELAKKLADIFDQYQIYRQDILKHWENDELATDSGDEPWQKALWLAVRRKAGSQFPSKAATRDFILQQCNDPEAVAAIKKQLPAIFIFGTVLITEFHRELLLGVSQFLPVYLFLPNPAPDIYWYEDKSRREVFYQQKKGKQIAADPAANPLLLDWGKLIQNTFQLLFKSDEAINLYEPLQQAHFNKDTLLHAVQYYLATNEVPDPNDFFSDDQLADESVAIQSCHSVTREVQTLYNYLVHLMDKHPGTYASRDIVVHVTDINLYASYIRSVFDNAPYKFKYTIADESYTSSDSLSGALYELLSMDEKSLTAEAVLQLLDFSCIRNHYQITDTGFIRETVNAANIRHSIHGDTSNDSIYVSWRYGLQRIMYGVCISGSESYGEGQERFFPLDTIEGSNAADIIHFCYFADKLIHFIEKKNTEQSLQAWCSYVLDVMHHFIFDDEKNDAEEFRMLLRLLENIAKVEQHFPQKISYAVFAKQFLPQLNNAIHESRYATGGITFCSLIPMRSIPFRIVAMLGLDFDKFPRKENKTGFDLMTRYPRAGDRNLKVNDKHLFMETILSAKDYLYLSYKGQSIQDNSKRPPSILLDQLIAFIESYAQNNGKVLDYLLTKQPLHNFSSKYGNEKGFYNYLLTQKDAVNIKVSNPAETQGSQMIRLSDFLAFFRDPVKYYYNETLHIYYDEQSYTLPETELFELDQLGKWTVKNAWLREREKTLDDFTRTGIQVGMLPLKNSGKLEMQLIAGNMEALRTEFQHLAGNHRESSLNISLSLGAYILEGSLPQVYGHKILYPCLSKTESKHLFITYLMALVNAASDSELEVIFLGSETRKGKPVSSETARTYLSELLCVYVEGLSKAVFFYPEWGTDLEKIRSLDRKGFEKINMSFNNYYTAETEDMETQKILEAYQSIAERVLKGLGEIF